MVAETVLQWRHNECDGVSNHQLHDCFLNRLFSHRSTKTSKLRVTGLCEENSPMTGDFPAQRVSNTENVSIWWRHHVVKWDRDKHVKYRNVFLNAHSLLHILIKTWINVTLICFAGDDDGGDGGEDNNDNHYLYQCWSRSMWPYGWAIMI